MIAVTTAELCGVMPRSRTKLRSTFSSLIGKRRQVGERRVAGAEVVDRNLDADLVQADASDGITFCRSFMKPRLGDLELNRVVRARHTLVTALMDVLDQIGSFEQAGSAG